MFGPSLTYVRSRTLVKVRGGERRRVGDISTPSDVGVGLFQVCTVSVWIVCVVGQEI